MCRMFDALALDYTFSSFHANNILSMIFFYWPRSRQAPTTNTLWNEINLVHMYCYDVFGI